MLSQNFKLRADLMKTPVNADLLQGIDQEHIEKIIPERLFLFLVSSLRTWIFWMVKWRTCWDRDAKRAIKTYYMACQTTKS